jgi:hypothetical protein
MVYGWRNDLMSKSTRDPDSLNRRVKCNDCGETLHPGATSCNECGSGDINEDWNSLLSAYSKHDIGEAYFKGHVEQIGLQVEHWGIDRRHEDDHLIFDNKMDLRLWDPMDEQDVKPEWPDLDVTETITEEFDLGLDTVTREWELRGVADVKTKASESWFGVFNLRHLAHYAEWAARYDAPAFVYMTMVDPDAEQVGEEEFLTPITPDWPWEMLIGHYDGDTDLSYGEIKDIARECDIVDRTFRAPDGNLVIEIADSKRNNWDYLVENVL